jgi:hypothetical protein
MDIRRPNMNKEISRRKLLTDNKITEIKNLGPHACKIKVS